MSRPHGNVHVVHVLQSNPYDVALRQSQVENQLVNSDQCHLRRQAIFELTQVLDRNDFNLTKAQIHIRSGEPANEIKQLAHDMEIDLVIVGGHCKQGGWPNLPNFNS